MSHWKEFNKSHNTETWDRGEVVKTSFTASKCDCHYDESDGSWWTCEYCRNRHGNPIDEVTSDVVSGDEK